MLMSQFLDGGYIPHLPSDPVLLLIASTKNEAKSMNSLQKASQFAFRLSSRQSSTIYRRPIGAASTHFHFLAHQHDAAPLPEGCAAGSRSFSAPPTPKYHNVPETPKGGGFHRMTFIGAGKMAESMITPVIKNEILSADKVCIYDVSNKIMAKISKQHPGIQTSSSIPEAITDSDLIVLAVKPQNLPKVYQEVQRARALTRDPESGIRLNENAALLSVIAGKPIQSYTKGTGLSKIARSMPNTPAQIGRGMTVWSCTSAVDAEERQKINQVLCSFGKAIFVEDESFIDMSTSISGSGPAYIFLLMEAMIDAGVHMGFSRDTATTLVHHTLLGSTLYAMETGEHPAVLRNSVTSPAGTTASAIYELENGKFRTVIKDAIWACYRRSLEMGGHDSNVGPGRPNVEPTVETLKTGLQDAMEEAFEDAQLSVLPAGKGDTLKEPPSGEMVLGDDKANGTGNGGKVA